MKFLFSMFTPFWGLLVGWSFAEFLQGEILNAIYFAILSIPFAICWGAKG